MVATLPVARLERLPDVGRLVPEEMPERLAELIDTEPVPRSGESGGAGAGIDEAAAGVDASVDYHSGASSGEPLG